MSYNQNNNYRGGYSHGNASHNSANKGSKFPMKPKTLSGNRQEAMMQLFDCRGRDETKAKIKKEIPILTLYATYALNNIFEQININKLNEAAKKKYGDQKGISLEEKLKLADDSAIRRLANFLWLFQIDNPYVAFSGEDDYRKFTIALAVQIENLRNYLAHPGMQGIKPLLTGGSLYKLLEGYLRPMAEREAEQPGMQTEKLFKIKFLNMHEKGISYEFTRRGLIFLISLALYRDQAMEFLQQFDDMALPERCVDADCASTPECQKKCKVGRVKAFQTAFTFFSIRRGRQAADLEEAKFATFADIIGYLNKTPKVSWDTLSLDNERKKLEELSAASTESEENKETKYILHSRFRDRFLQLATAYCEDYDVLPSLRFKRLCLQDAEHLAAITDPEILRTRYCFGKENDNRVRMDRHYAITHDAINFEFRPAQHYGDIKIDALRSRLSSGQLKQLLALSVGKLGKKKDIDKFLSDYFTAYHKLLERMVNTKDGEEIYMEHYYEELKTIIGATEDELDGVDNLVDMEQLAGQYLPKSLSRFFIPDDTLPDIEELRQELEWKLGIYIDKDEQFLQTLKDLNAWKAARKKYNEARDKGASDEENPPPPMPLKCKKISDGTLVSKVFHLFNCYLAPEKRFRQIPLGEQHRPGIEDYEYQLIHKMIGKFSLDPKGLWLFMEKNHPELSDVCTSLKKETDKLFKKEQAELARNPQTSKDGKPVRATKSLTMLATAAVNLHIQRCIDLSRKWEDSSFAEKHEGELREDCRIYHVRQGMLLDRQALVKTILHVDEELWRKAYDRDHGENHFDRTLDKEGHIVSQIPIPNDLINRCAAKLVGSNKNWQWALAENGHFDFNRKNPDQSATAMDRLLECKETELRDFYDIAPITAFLKKKKNVTEPVAGLNPLMAQLQISKTQLDKRARGIRDVELQDKLLLLIALQYRADFMGKTTFFDGDIKFGETKTIYDYYDTKIVWIKGKGDKAVTVTGTPNDVLRPSLNKIFKLETLDPLLKRIGADVKECTFYKLLEALRMVEASDRKKRLEILPRLVIFEAEVTIDDMMYVGKDKDEIKEMEFAEYKKVFPSITMEEYEALSKIRNKVFHDGLDLDIDKASAILKKYV